MKRKTQVVAVMPRKQQSGTKDTMQRSQHRDKKRRETLLLAVGATMLIGTKTMRVTANKTEAMNARMEAGHSMRDGRKTSAVLVMAETLLRQTTKMATGRNGQSD